MAGLFDFNRNRKTSAMRRTHEFLYLDRSFEDDAEELEASGFDYDDLDSMDEYERAELLEDAGLDPDDYDF